MSRHSFPHVRELADRFCTGTLTPTEAEQLTNLLRDNSDAQQAFLEVTSIYARLQSEFSDEMPTADSPSPPAEESAASGPAAVVAVTKHSSLATLAWKALAAVAAAVLIGYLLVSIFWLPAERPLAKVEVLPVVAKLVSVVDSDWEEGFAPLSNALSVQRLRLQQGLAAIEFADGAIAVLRAPVDIELIASNEAFLHAGQAVIRVPKHGPAKGFRLETPTSKLLDLGTEFGVEVDQEGSSLLQVYEGEVLATAKAAATTSPTRVREGEAAQLDHASEETAFWPERFVRELPGPDDPSGPGCLPYNQSRFDSVQIAPARRPLTIDGDLSDWDLSTRFRSTAMSPYAENYYLEAAMMFDAEHLYVSAHVGDPHAMQSQISPLESADLHGAGGSVALRLSTDRQAGWPLEAMNPSRRRLIKRPANPADVSDKLAFIVLWFYEPEQKPCIHLRYGMDLHGTKVNPLGYRGAFVKDADGLGYTLEYAIEWQLLNCQHDPPRGGDQLAAMWLAHWSNANGRSWQGQIIDVTNPHETGWNFIRAATWGQANYLKQAPAADGHR